MTRDRARPASRRVGTSGSGGARPSRRSPAPVPSRRATPTRRARARGRPRRPTTPPVRRPRPVPGRPPGGNAWGADLPDVDDELASEIDPSTPPHGMDLSALRGTGPRHGVPDQGHPDDVEDARNGSERRNGSDGHARLDLHDDDAGYDERATTRPSPGRSRDTPSNGRRAAPAPAVDEEPARRERAATSAGSGPHARSRRADRCRRRRRPDCR